jgi:hypothetical protein
LDAGTESRSLFKAVEEHKWHGPIAVPVPWVKDWLQDVPPKLRGFILITDVFGIMGIRYLDFSSNKHIFSTTN